MLTTLSSQDGERDVYLIQVDLGLIGSALSPLLERPQHGKTC
jgi:hypothetical protein